MGKVCGVYRITCVPNGKVYIGSTTDVARRWKQHRSHLNRGTHGNPHLLAAWSKYGADAFRFEVVEETSEADRLEREAHWVLASLASLRDYGFNIDPVPTDPGAVSDETRGRQRAAWTPDRRARLADENRSREYTDESRAAMSQSWSERVRAKIAATLRGRSLDDAHRAQISEGLRGHTVSDETRARIGAANAQQLFIATDPDGREYVVTNLTAFCREHGLQASNMVHVATGRRTHTKGWGCRYATE